jgi:hypothetical protein
MAWRVAKSLEKLRSQVNAEWPQRDKSSDGTIGDEKHASRSSDHNPWVKDGKTGVVTGMDITNDPDSGPVSNDIAEALKASEDPRIKYIISNARICSGDAGPSPWVWRKYSGSNAHRHHVHISVKSEKPLYDSVKPWRLVAKVPKFVEPVAVVHEAPEDDPEIIGEPPDEKMPGGDGFPAKAMKVVKSKIAWASTVLGGVSLASVGDFLRDWRTITAIGIIGLVAYIIYERSRKP